ncbi:methyl-accepting chemotaxis protein [Agathobaculum desmolans]|uniref:methyl-accepting chemotaxis protein n=1 Tax=Agathobaculum desmolans TaxID=39484 RepID=UPI00248E786E|nr:methyl-accepting chemotaxis protein [Agathobaculum desmolans]
MKNWKVKNKLRISFAILIVLMLIISAISILGLSSLHQENGTLVNKTLANTEYVWEMRRNLMSEQRYVLMAFAEKDKQAMQEYSQAAQEEVVKNSDILKQYFANTRVEQDKINALDTCFNAQTAHRNKIIELLGRGTEESVDEAYGIFEAELKPLLEQQADLLAEIGNEQNDLARQQVEKGEKTYWGMLTLIIALIVLSILVSFVITVALIKMITYPMQQITNAAHSLSQGDFDAHITYESTDEMGATCKSMQDSFAALKAIIMDISTVLGALSNGDLSVSTDVEYPGEMHEIHLSIEKLIRKLNMAFGEIKRAAYQINSGSDQVSNGAQALAQGATEQASSVEELAATISDVSDRVQTNSENARKANALAADAGDVAQDTLRDMNNMIEAMQEISNTSEDIGKIIKVIDDIAFQTNILALNAAVEAARAGSAGKGFAVVADEVRNLAGKSAEAAKDTTALIDQSIRAVSHGSEIANKANEAFKELREKVDEVVTTINMISAASAEQATNIQQISEGVDQISAVVQTNSATSEESAAASEELSGQANELERLIEQFRLAD